MSVFVTGNMHYIRAPFVANIKPGHRVLILSDFSHDPRVWQVVQAICAELGAETTVALFERRPADYYDPPSAVCEAMMKSDFNVLLASTGMLHSHASFTAMAAGIPSICMDGGMTLEWFQSGAVTEDMKQMAVRKHYVAKRVFGPNAHECRVTSRYGTDFTYSVADRITQPPLPGPSFDPYKIINFAKDENRPGNNLLYYLFPTGEFNVAPVEGSANGKLVIDLTMHHIGRLLTPIELTVKKGRVTRSTAGRRRASCATISRNTATRTPICARPRPRSASTPRRWCAASSAKTRTSWARCTSGSAPTSTSAARSSRRSTWTA